MTDKATEKSTQRHQAGAFDVRTFIAMLIGLYGVILVLTGLFGTSDAAIERSAGVNINLLAGTGMVVFAAAFQIWAKIRPVVVPEAADEEHQEARAASSGTEG